MKFIHITDTHVIREVPADRADAGLLSLGNPERAFRCLKEADWNGVDFAVFTGDLVHEGTAEDYRYLQTLVQKAVPDTVQVFYVLGNHDNKRAFYEAFYGTDAAEPYFYKKEIDGYRLLILDSAIPGKESGTMTQVQMDFLREELRAPAENGTIVFLHHPVFWNGAGGDSFVMTNGDEVLRILEGTDVFAVFCGHTHMSAVNVRGNISQYTADSASFSLEVRQMKELAVNDKIGYTVAEIRGQNVYAHFEKCFEAEHEVTVPLQLFMEQVKKLDE